MLVLWQGILPLLHNAVRMQLFQQEDCAGARPMVKIIPLHTWINGEDQEVLHDLF